MANDQQYKTVQVKGEGELRFPSSMSDEDIKGVLDEKFGNKQSAWTDTAEQAAVGPAKGALNSMATVYDMLSGMSELAEPITKPIDEFLGTDNIDVPALNYKANSEVLRDAAENNLPKADTAVGGVAGALAQFALPFTAANKAINSSKLAASGLRKAAASGAIADFSAFDPHEDRLANFLTEFDSPLLNNMVTQYLAADEDDTALEGRMKSMVEGLGIGAAVDGLVKGLKWIKAARRARGERKIQETLDEVASTKAEAGEAALDESKAKSVIYRHAATEADKVDNLNLSKYPMRPTTKGFMEQVENVFGEKVPKRSWPTTDSMAKDLGVTPKDFIDMSKYYKDADVVMAKAHSQFTDMTRALKERADKIRGGVGTEEDMAQFVSGLTQYVDFKNALKRSQAGLARSLNKHRDIRTAGLTDTEAVDEFLKTKDITRDHIKVMANVFSEAETVGQARRMAEKFIQKPTRVDAALEVYVNSLLSGLRTHATNVLSTGTSVLYTLPERYVAAGIGATRKALGSKSTNYATFKEANAYAKGLAQGSVDAMGILGHALKDTGKAFKDSVKTGGRSLLREPDADLTKIKVGDTILSDPLGKIELEKHQAFRGDVILGKKGSQKLRKTSRGLDILGEWVFRLPGRALYLGDSVMKTMGYRMELNASATRHAMDELNQGVIKQSQLDSRIKELFDNAVSYGQELPDKIAKSDKVYKQLHDYAMENGARYLTFTRQLGSKGRALQHITSNPVMRSLVPFVRTPVNILKFSGERTPAAPLSAKVRKTLKAGTAESDIQAARIAFSSLLGVGVFNAAQEGYITGSWPNFDPEQKQRRYDVGLQPTSIVYNGETYSLSRLEPIATLFGVAADMNQIWDYMSQDEAEHIGSMMVASITNNFTNKTYMKTLVDLANTMQDPDRYMEDFLKDYAASIATAPVPGVGGTFGAHWAQSQDPYLKDAQTLTQAIKTRIPWMRGEVPDRLNDYGEKIKIGESLGPNLISPIFKKELTDSPLKKAVYKLGVNLNDPDRTLNGVELNQKQYYKLKKAQGEFFNMVGGNWVRSKEFRDPRTPDGIKRMMLEDAWSKAREMSKIEVWPEIVDEIQQQKLKEQMEIIE